MSKRLYPDRYIPSPPRAYPGPLFPNNFRRFHRDKRSKNCIDAFNFFEDEVNYIMRIDDNYPPRLLPISHNVLISALREDLYTNGSFQTLGDLFLKAMVFEFLEKQYREQDRPTKNVLFDLLQSNSVFAVFSEYYRIPDLAEHYYPTHSGRPVTDVKAMANLWECFFGAVYQHAKVQRYRMTDVEKFLKDLLLPLVPAALHYGQDRLADIVERRRRRGFGNRGDIEYGRRDELSERVGEEEDFDARGPREYAQPGGRFAHGRDGNNGANEARPAAERPAPAMPQIIAQPEEGLVNEEGGAGGAAAPATDFTERTSKRSRRTRRPPRMRNVDRAMGRSDIGGEIGRQRFITSLWADGGF